MDPGSGWQRGHRRLVGTRGLGDHSFLTAVPCTSEIKVTVSHCHTGRAVNHCSSPPTAAPRAGPSRYQQPLLTAPGWCEAHSSALSRLQQLPSQQ